MQEESFDKGSILTIEITFYKNDAFTAKTKFDPDNYPKITIIDPDGTKKVDGANLTKYAVGEWYYKLQTATTWVIGEYEIKIEAVSGASTDITIEPKGFILK